MKRKTIHDPEPRTIRPFEVGRPYVTKADDKLYVTVDDTQRGCYVVHPAVVKP